MIDEAINSQHNPSNPSQKDLLILPHCIGYPNASASVTEEAADKGDSVSQKLGLFSNDLTIIVISNDQILHS